MDAAFTSAKMDSDQGKASVGAAVTRVATPLEISESSFKENVGTDDQENGGGGKFAFGIFPRYLG
jgi:hypothetical protein